MLFLTKLLTELLFPLTTAIGLFLLALVLNYTSWKKLAQASLILGIGWLWLWSMPVFSEFVRHSLEGRYDQLEAKETPEGDVIVVFGGAFDAWHEEWPYPNLQRAADRYWHAARLFHAAKAPRIIVSGGRMPWRGDGLTEADAGSLFLSDLGVPESAILVEGEAQTTRDNALLVREIMDENDFERVILVTSALHMRRAIATFHAVGIDPIPAATDFEVYPDRSGLDRWLPRAKTLSNSNRAIKEYAGFLVYRFRGWVAPAGT